KEIVMHLFHRSLVLVLARAGAVFLASLLAAGTASAALQVSLQALPIEAGGTGFVDVYVRGNSGETIDIFGLELRITQLTASGASLEFIDPPPDPQLLDPNYLFFGDSAAALLPPAGIVTSVTNTNDTYIGGDGTLSGLGAVVPNSDTLLARVEIQ